MPSPLQDLHQQKNFLFFLSHVSGAYSQKKTLKLLRVKPCSISNLKNIFWTPCLTIINVTGFCVPTVIFAFRISCYSVIFWPYFSVLLFIISTPKFSSSCLFLKVKTQSPSYVVLSPLDLSRLRPSETSAGRGSAPVTAMHLMLTN